VAFFLVGAIVLLSRGQTLAAGALMGLGLWVKIPGLLALPALILGVSGWRARAQFTLAWAGVGILGYAPVLLQDARVVIDSVFLYSGLRIQTQTGVQIWGIQNFYPDPAELSYDWRQRFLALSRFGFRHNTLVSLVPIAIVAWCRRRDRDGLSLARNVACSYVILYGFTNFFAFQYFAWSLPLWLALDWRLALAASAIVTAYIYGLYAWLCSSLALQGYWDFIGRSEWPGWILALRDCATLLFFVAAWVIIIRALRTEWRAVSPLRPTET